MGMDVYGKNPTTKEGEYFRANIWSWRPIHALCETVLKRKLPGWEFNEGAGFETQEECSTLADGLEPIPQAISEGRDCAGVGHSGGQGRKVSEARSKGRRIALPHGSGARDGVHHVPAFMRGIRDFLTH